MTMNLAYKAPKQASKEPLTHRFLLFHSFRLADGGELPVEFAWGDAHGLQDGGDGGVYGGQARGAR